MPAQALIDRYRDLLLKLMPPGLAISRSLDSNFADLFGRIAIEFARVDERARDLRREGVPATADEMLSDWEEALGLPEECFTPTTLDERRRAVVERIVGTGGNSLADYTALAASLGYPAPVFTTYQPFVAGSHAGERLYNGPWRSAALVTLSTGAIDALIECAFERQALEHESLLFEFITGEMVAIDGEVVGIDSVGVYV